MLVFTGKRHRNQELIIKICGICNSIDLQNAVKAGANAIGFMLYSASKRYINLETAAKLRQNIPAKVRAVAVMLNPTKEEVMATIKKLQPDLLQFHGDESESFCASFSWPYIKVLSVADNKTTSVIIVEKASQYKSASYIMLDTRHKAILGGSGKKFNWKLIPNSLPIPLIIAGGLNPRNVASLITQTNPSGVDVSTGVEDSPGIKNKEKMNAFINACHRAWRTVNLSSLKYE